MAAPSEQVDNARFKIIHRDDYSLPMRLLHLFISPFRPMLVKPKLRRDGEAPRLTPPKKVSKSCHIHERDVEGIWVYDITAKQNHNHNNNREKLSKRVYYFCGGGWQAVPSPRHWTFVAELAQKVPNTTISLISYPLAPSSPASTSLPRLRLLYDFIMRQSSQAGETVVFAGDSSGGNIILSLVIWAAQSPDVPAPAGVVAISPSTDLQHAHPDIDRIWDPVLSVPFILGTAGAWVGAGHPGRGQIAVPRHVRSDWSLWDPRVSPVLANLGLLAERAIKIFGIHGTYDLLSAEAAEFRDLCRESGVEGEWLEWEKQMHCFPLAFPFGLRESKEGLAWVIEKISAL